MLNTVEKKKSNVDTQLYPNKSDQNYNASRSHDDENILKKLAEMSMQISNDSNLSNLDFKTGAVSKHSPNKSNHHEIKFNNEPSRIKKSAFELMEAELFPSMSRNENLDDLITKDLNAYLKAHNIKDGNLVETRRIDLRQSQNMAPVNKKVYSKTLADTLFENILNNDECNDWDKVLKDSKNNKLKFLNENSSDSESSDNTDSEDNGVDRALWIERYRKQKLANSNAKKSS